MEGRDLETNKINEETTTYFDVHPILRFFARNAAHVQLSYY